MKKRNRPSRHERRTIQFVPSGAYEIQPLHRQIFQEDVQLMGHLSSPRRGEEPKLRLEGAEEERSKVGALCSSMADYPRHWPEENVAGAIEKVVAHLADRGKAMFEIAAEAESSTLSLLPFDPDHVWNLVLFYLQVAPPASWHDLDRKYALINKSGVWRVDMPQDLGGAAGFRKVLKELSAWSSLGPEFYHEDLKRRQLPKEFVFGDYRRAHQIQLYRVTRAWGWNGRDWSLDYVTEYYQFYRHLTFKWAQAVLREHIVREFNSLFRRLGISAQIIMEGPSSPADILKVREQMQAGVLDFAGATKAIR